MSRFRSPAHDSTVSARLGVLVGATFGICFLTGLLSHLVQHPPSWFWWPPSPAWLYRLTQGTHVASGVAAIPLLVAKLWSVYPKLFDRPVVRSPAHGLERASILVLSGSALFLLVTGIFNTAQNYLWSFYFPAAHYAVAWIAVGSLLVHVAVKLPVARAGLAERPDPQRRRFLRTAGAGAGLAVLATAGSTVPLLRDVSVLASSSDRGPQGLPVNRTAAAAGIVVPERWRLIVVGAVTREFDYAALTAMATVSEDLPIACVEGWSASATWTGVPIADLVRAVGGSPERGVRVESLEREGLYRASTLPVSHAADPRTLLALRVNGAVLAPDHGYPCRLVAPNRPGVTQTKWVTRLEVV
jgi:DMSO/TMAO reductase YedYZ molybdopterin-dependent catalytic subunit